MRNLNESFTSTGSKFFYHQEAMQFMRDGKGMPITTHVMSTDICNHTCAFCSVATREGSVLSIDNINSYLTTLCKYGLKAVILSGGGNPILYKCPKTKANFNDLVAMIYAMGLEIGLITNGMPLMTYPDGRMSWKTVSPETLDKCKWIRISMAGLDHSEKTVYVPDIDRTKTTLGFSYVYHDIYEEPLDKNHGKVSTMADLQTPIDHVKVIRGEDRLLELGIAFRGYVELYKPTYLRLLPNCLEPSHIERRCEQLQILAENIDPDIVFVQYKPPAAPNVCYLGYIHPVLNSDGYVYPCDSCVLNSSANHKFANPWRICHWSEIAKIYETPIKSLVNPKEVCPGCVFTKTNNLLEGIRNGEPTPIPVEQPIHPNFI